MTVRELAWLLQDLPRDLGVFITNGDLPDAPVASVAVVPADFGQRVLISRDNPAPILGYIVDGKTWHPSDVRVVRRVDG